jgi:hypothetical protein
MHRFRLGRALLFGATLAWPASPFAEPVDAEPAATEPTATEQAPAEPRSAQTERSQEQEMILQRQLPASEQRELQAGEEAFLALWLPALGEQAEGTVILVPGYGQHANHPNAIGPLRNRLPDAGWNSLSISLPDALNGLPPSAGTEPETAAAPPQTIEQSETSEQSAPEDPAAPERLPIEQSQMPPASIDAAAEPGTPPGHPEQLHAERIFARIDAAVAFAQSEQSAQIVLAGTGTGAYWAARYTTEHPAGAVQRLALISLRSPTARALAQEPAALPDLPTLDLFYRNRSDEQSAARQRQLASQRQKHKHYQALGLQALPADRDAEREQLYRRLRGWLSPLQD